MITKLEKNPSDRKNGAGKFGLKSLWQQKSNEMKEDGSNS